MAIKMPEQSIVDNRVPKISIVMPIYNAESYLCDTLKTIQQQSFKDFEIILIDDGSTDGTSEIAKHFSECDSRFVYIRKSNTGAALSRNLAIPLIRGEYTLFLDSDDLFDLQLLEILYRAVLDSDADVCICCADIFSSIPGDLGKRFAPGARMPQGVYEASSLAEHFYQRVTTVPWDKLIRTSIFRDHQIFFQNIRYSNDNYFVLMSLAYAKRIAYIDDVLVHYRVGLGSSLRDTMYKDPLCDLVMLDALRAGYFALDLPSVPSRPSLEEFCLDVSFKNFLVLLRQDREAALAFYQRFMDGFSSAWYIDVKKRSVFRSAKSKFKAWCFSHVSFKGFAWAVDTPAVATARSIGKSEWKNLIARLLIAALRFR